jgi:hypothetical protein
MMEEDDGDEVVKVVTDEEITKLMVFFSYLEYIPKEILRLMVKDMLETGWEFAYMARSLYKIDCMWKDWY